MIPPLATRLTPATKGGVEAGRCATLLGIDATDVSVGVWMAPRALKMAIVQPKLKAYLAKAGDAKSLV